MTNLVKQPEYEKELQVIMDSVNEKRRSDFVQRFTNRSKSPLIIFGFSWYLGMFGIDRFLLGQPLLGVFKLFTLGGVFVWQIIDLFRVGGITRRQNLELARKIASEMNSSDIL